MTPQQGAHVAVRFLVLDPNPRALAPHVEELMRRGIDGDAISLVGDSETAIRGAMEGEAGVRLVAFLPWPVVDAFAVQLVRVLRQRGSYLVAMVPPDEWRRAPGARDAGADDVLLTPCPPDAFAVRALLGGEAARRSSPLPWHRPRVALREALAHPSGGEVFVRANASTSRILVVQGRIAWVHANGEAGSLLEHLTAFGVQITADELTAVIAECRRTGQHFTAVLSDWQFADRETVRRAACVLLNGRLQAALSRSDATALFLPSGRSQSVVMGFTDEELGRTPTSIPPGPSHESLKRVELPSEDKEALEAVVRRLRGLGGCVAAAILHYGAAEIVHARGPARLDLAWTLGAAIADLDDPNADVLACSSDHCHIARRIPGDIELFLYAVFDQSAVPLALARRHVASAISRVTRATS